MLDISPGLMIWTLINFGIFAFLIKRFAWKPLTESLAKREFSITDALEKAQTAKSDAERILKENEAKMAKAQQEMMQLVRDGREQAQAQIQAAAEEAEKVKRSKLDEARREIDREKEAAMKALRTEVSSLVVMATEKILKEKMDTDYQRKVVDSVLQDISRN